MLPLVRALNGPSRLRADATLERWTRDGDPWLRHAASGVAARITP
ncbi:hypothetical protein [Cryobacterium sp. Y62]|nr:hypothetical protein [Cryobacterium sp. Y62]